MRLFGSPPSVRSLEWRVAAAWIFLVFSLLFPPVTSSRDPYLIRHSPVTFAIDFGAAAVSLVLTVQPITRGGIAVKMLAAPCAILAAWRLAGWVVLLVVRPTSLSFPVWD